MSATVIGSATVAFTAAAAVVVSTMPEAEALFAPIIEGNEYATTAAGLLISFPIVALLTMIAGSCD